MYRLRSAAGVAHILVALRSRRNALAELRPREHERAGYRVRQGVELNSFFMVRLPDEAIQPAQNVNPMFAVLVAAFDALESGVHHAQSRPPVDIIKLVAYDGLLPNRYSPSITASVFEDSRRFDDSIGAGAFERSAVLHAVDKPASVSIRSSRARIMIPCGGVIYGVIAPPTNDLPWIRECAENVV